jgi:alkylation response protein AidB-like acyl-CoA dehydrogenase
MPSYTPPLGDIRFLLSRVLDADQLSHFKGYEDATTDLMLSVAEEGGRLCAEIIAPLNQKGDAEGCTYDNGEVRTPAGFKAAYDAYREAGWTAMIAPTEFGGQGLPQIVGTIIDEMLCSANLSFSMYPLLAHGATTAIEKWGDDELKQRYLPRLVDGTWGGSMCLTESQAGTDLGIIRTRAVPTGDGSYAITGTKIFISAGEHDLTENIVHLVLAKLPDAPAGTRGISLFIVPKFLTDEDGRIGARNGVRCGSIEHKMGIKGNATCVMNFDNAVGWLVGEPHKGMRGMFTMMNSARVAVGMQGLGLAEVAYQNALSYAKDRLQGRAPTGATNPSGDADPIIVHPDVRRMLMTMKAYVEGMRALAYWVGILIDVETRHDDAAKRAEAEDLVALMTPVIKAFLTDTGFDITNIALQCYGGHGYIGEYGMEQFVRDARIAQIYEGTNGVQAMDLLGRKIPDDNGRMARRFAAIVQRDLQAAAQIETVAPLVAPVADAMNRLQRTTAELLARAAKNPDEVGAAAVDYLRMFGLASIGWMWIRMAVAATKLGDDDAALRDDKLATARFYISKLLPQVRALCAQIDAGSEVVMAASLAT